MLGAGDFIMQYDIRGPTALEMEGVRTTRGIMDIKNLDILVALWFGGSVVKAA
jgi:hypothetical protein